GSAACEGRTAEELDAIELGTPPAPELGVAPPGGGGGRGGPGAPGAPGTPQGGRQGGPGGVNPQQFAQARADFLRAEGALGTFSTSARGHGVYTIGGAQRTTDPATLLPAITITAEHYGRIAR